MRFLITGAAGFIGSNFVRFMLDRYPDDEFVVLDKLTYAGRRENLDDIADHIEFVKGDICQREDVEKTGSCDVIVNFAAESHVDRSINDPGLFIRTDILGTHTLLEYARKNEVKRFLQVSTDEVYGSIEKGSFSANDPLNPSSPYSASKAGADLIALAYFKTYGLPVLITRCSNNFGPYQFPEKLIPVLILRALKNQSLPIYGDGTNVRDWIYVMDHCSAIDRVMSRGSCGNIYTIGTGYEKTNLEIAKLILQSLHKPEGLITFVGDRPGHDFRYSLSAKEMNQLGWNPQYGFEKALEETILWYVQNEWWWQPLINAP
ncbi:MAG TPA: dTDP-glucose 4,6-dehydratase [Methanoculleus sp.]|nr:dTDP-glucose 4,6-dehydratase [Methanoculleus sp.]